MSFSFTVYVSSQAPSLGYPNSPASFRVRLPHSLNLSDVWVVSIEVLSGPRPLTSKDIILVTCNLVEPSIVNSFLHPVLRVLPSQESNLFQSNSTSLEKKVRQHHQEYIQIELRNAQGQFTSFRASDLECKVLTWCILRFRQTFYSGTPTGYPSIFHLHGTWKTSRFFSGTRKCVECQRFSTQRREKKRENKGTRTGKTIETSPQNKTC